MLKNDLNGKTVLVTGVAGFIGTNLVLRLLHDVINIEVVGIDDVNDYYDVSIKEWRLSEIQKCADQYSDSTWRFVKGNIANKTLIDSIFRDYTRILIS